MSFNMLCKDPSLQCNLEMSNSDLSFRRPDMTGAIQEVNNFPVSVWNESRPFLRPITKRQETISKPISNYLPTNPSNQYSNQPFKRPILGGDKAFKGLPTACNKIAPFNDTFSNVGQSVEQTNFPTFGDNLASDPHWKERIHSSYLAQRARLASERSKYLNPKASESVFPANPTNLSKFESFEKNGKVMPLVSNMVFPEAHSQPPINLQSKNLKLANSVQNFGRPLLGSRNDIRQYSTNSMASNHFSHFGGLNSYPDSLSNEFGDQHHGELINSLPSRTSTRFKDCFINANLKADCNSLSAPDSEAYNYSHLGSTFLETSSVSKPTNDIFSFNSLNSSIMQSEETSSILQSIGSLIEDGETSCSNNCYYGLNENFIEEDMSNWIENLSLDSSESLQPRVKRPLQIIDPVSRHEIEVNTAESLTGFASDTDSKGESIDGAAAPKKRERKPLVIIDPSSNAEVLVDACSN